MIETETLGEEVEGLGIALSFGRTARRKGMRLVEGSEPEPGGAGDPNDAADRRDSPGDP